MNITPDESGFRRIAEDLLEELDIDPTPKRVIAVLQAIRDALNYALSRAIAKKRTGRREDA